MVEYNMSDKEQVEMIKKWWKDYGQTIAIAIVIGLAVAFGWRYWHQHKQFEAQKAAALYGQLSVAAAQSKVNVAKSIAITLKEKHTKTPYATMATLWWARELVKEGKYQAAFEKLEWVFEHSKVAGFRQLARIRAARILLAEKKPEVALGLLKKVEDKGYEPLIEEVKGDIYMAMKKPEQARKAYKLAESGFKANDVANPILNMKVAQP